MFQLILYQKGRSTTTTIAIPLFCTVVQTATVAVYTPTPHTHTRASALTQPASKTDKFALALKVSVWQSFKTNSVKKKKKRERVAANGYVCLSVDVCMVFSVDTALAVTHYVDDTSRCCWCCCVATAMIFFIVVVAQVYYTCVCRFVWRLNYNFIMQMKTGQCARSGWCCIGLRKR